MKPGKYFFILILVTIALPLWSQTTPVALADASAEGGDPMLPRVMTYILMGTVALIFLATMYYVVTVNQFLNKKVLELEASKAGIALPDATEAPAETADSFWTRMRKEYWEDVVPVDREHEIMKDHAYDGIRELDNSLPPWWVNMFILTVIWAAIFMFYYHFGGGGPDQYEYYEREMEQAKKEQAIALASQANAVDESNVIVLEDATALGEGELIYKNNCASCHGQAGEGGIGPNMTDEYWIHGGSINDVFKTIKYGVPEKGMIAWSAQLNAGDMQKVASYIMTSLVGTNAPNGKEPQGELYQPEEKTAPSDSTAVSAGEAGSMSAVME